MQKIVIKKRNGFSILAVILVVVALIVAIGVWALSGESNLSTSGSSTNKIQAASIINDSSSIKSAFDTVIINKSISPNSITFVPGVSSSTNMLDPVDGLSVPQVAGQALFANALEPDGIYVYTKNLTVNMNGVNNAHNAILLSGVKDTVCAEINNTTNGTTTIPAYTSFTNSNQFTAGATKNDPNTSVVLDFQSHGLSTGNITENWMSGCISAGGTANQNLYFRILR